MDVTQISAKFEQMKARILRELSGKIASEEYYEIKRILEEFGDDLRR